jgi:hypothetical protein
MRIRIYLASLISLLLTGCVTRAPTLNMLEQTADYDGSKRVSESLGELKGPLIQPYRTEAKTTDILIHRHEMPTGDYFLGGWIRAVIAGPRWEVDASTKPTIEEATPIETKK